MLLGRAQWAGRPGIRCYVNTKVQESDGSSVAVARLAFALLACGRLPQPLRAQMTQRRRDFEEKATEFEPRLHTAVTSHTGKVWQPE